MIDLSTKVITKLPNNNNTIDGAIMHPISKMIALRAGNKLIIRNLELNTDMKKYALPANQKIVFWKWLTNTIIAIVTEQAVFHWGLDGDSEPVKIFDRAAYDGAVQIVNYRASADNKFFILGGISGNNQQISGVLQLYAADLKKSQPVMDTPAACFLTTTLDGRPNASTLFCFTIRDPNTRGFKLNFHELGADKEIAYRRSEDFALPGGDADFVVNMLPDNKHGMIMMLTKSGYLIIVEAQSGKIIFNRQVTQYTFFVAGTHQENGGVVASDTTGRVVLFSIDEDNLVPYVTNVLSDMELGVKLASRFGLSGAGDIFKRQFQNLCTMGNIEGAIQLAVNSAQGVLRTLESIQLLQQAPVPQGGRAPLLQYFSTVMQVKGKLNKVESVELARPLVAANSDQTRKKIEDLIKEDKLEFSEELGDLLRSFDLRIACTVYYRSQSSTKVIGCFLQLGEYQKLIAYAKSVNFIPDYPALLGQLHRFKAEDARNFAVMLLNNPEGSLIDINKVITTFMAVNDVANTTGCLLDYLKARGDREEDGPLQTKLFEINLLAAPHVARAIFEQNLFHFFERDRVARLCEQAQLFQYALENYSEMTDIRRVIVNTHAIDPEFLLLFLGGLSAEHCLDCFRDLLMFNLQANVITVVEASKRYSDVLGADKLIALFESFNAWTGLFYYLQVLVTTTDSKDVVFKYVESCVKLDQRNEAVRVCQENNYYDPKQMKDYLIKINFKDPRALIHVCDRFDFVDELTRHFYGQNQQAVLEIYLTKMNPAATPAVVGTLLDLNCAEDYLQHLISTVPAPHADPTLPQHPHCPIGALVASVEAHNRLSMLRPWLELRLQEKNPDVELHNALAKIYVDANFNATHFLTNNPFYDSKIVGKYCESRDPHLAFLAYKRANGDCDDELIAISNTHGFFKDQARYLVERQNDTLWDKVLADDNTYRRQLIDQVIATGLPESRNADEVVNTVQAFMRAKLPSELIELLEKIVLHSPKERGFHNVKNLQNLLILTAIKADKKRVMQYVTRLDNFDGPQIAEIALGEPYFLFEEGFTIYNKFQKHAEAIEVLINKLENLQRASDYADVVDQAPVWSILAKAQLNAKLMKDSIASFIKAQDPSQWEAVIVASTEAETYIELISFLKMAREKVKEPAIDNELIACFAKTDQMSALEDFITKPSCIAKIEEAGDRCFELKVYQAARILYSHCNNQSKLALALIKLFKYSDAVEAARKANALPTWKAVCFACVDAKEFRLAAICGSNIIVYHAHLAEVVRHYENQGFFEEIIQLLEQGINLDRAHQGIFTELGVCYSKYKPEKLMEHIKLFWSKLNIPTLISSCREHLHWPEAVFLYSHYDQNDNAVDVLIEHSSDCWTNDLFKEIVVKSSSDKHYSAIQFYLSEHPLLLSELLIELSPKLDHSRVVGVLRDYGHLALIQKYLLFVQRDNIVAVNEAVNQLFVEEDNYKALRESIDSHDQFDQLLLAKQLERNELMNFRRISAYLYKQNKRFSQSIELSKKDEMWQDAMECAAESRDTELAESLLRFFVAQGLKECFSACLFSCYEFTRPDVVLELSWRFNLMNFAMPFMIQTMRDMNQKITDLGAKFAEKETQEVAEKKEEEKAKEEAASINAGGVMPGLMMPPMGMMPGMPMPNAPLQLTFNNPSMMPPPQYGAPMYGGPMGGMGMMPPHQQNMGGPGFY